jgi:hypothetical protein
MSQDKELPWFACYPDKWLKATREMTDTQARVYWDLLCLIYKNNGAVPAKDKWIAHELHMHVNKWIPVRNFLFKERKIFENADGTITNEKASQICLERKIRTERRVGVSQGVTPPGNPPSYPPQLPPGVDPQLSLEFNAGAPKKDPLHSHLHIIQSESKEERSSLGPYAGFAKEDEKKDQDDRIQKFPSTLKKQLVAAVGEEHANDIILDYVGIGYDKGAKHLHAAFKGWLMNNYEIALPKLGAMQSASLAKEILAMCGTDEHGNPDLRLPSKPPVFQRKAQQ